MNMTPKIYFFERKEDGDIRRVAAFSLAEATCKLPINYSWDSHWTVDLCQFNECHTTS